MAIPEKVDPRPALNEMEQNVGSPVPNLEMLKCRRRRKGDFCRIKYAHAHPRNSNDMAGTLMKCSRERRWSGLDQAEPSQSWRAA